MKLCIECKHIGNSPFGTINRYCRRPVGNSPVNGLVNIADVYCESERSCGLIESFLFGRCGKTARYFEAKEQQ